MTDNEENFPVQVDLQHVKAVLDVSLHGPYIPLACIYYAPNYTITARKEY